jgi:hypothetical protein
MKIFNIALLACIFSLSAFGQDVTGRWNGILKIQGIQLRIVFDIGKTGNGYQSTMDSPDQGATGIPVTATIYEHPAIKLSIQNAQIEYEGTLRPDGNITGTFKQGGFSVPMNLSKNTVEKEKIFRPQEPSKPYPYHEETIVFENPKASITLAGTLTLPQKEGIYPAVVLISGSGAQNRDEEVFGHKPFLVLADHLAKNGIAVLRFDDRGVASSGGVFNTATSADFAGDAEAAVQYLLARKEIHKKKIGLIGHSEGGMIAPMVAGTSNDVAFIVLLAGIGISGDQLLLLQQEVIGRASGVSEIDLAGAKKINEDMFDIVINSSNSERLADDIAKYLRQAMADNAVIKKPAGMSDDQFIQMWVGQLTSPWMQYFIKYNPVATLGAVRCPVLALNGEKDLQVPPKENLEAIKRAVALGGNKNVTIKEFPGLNHLFQECSTGLPAEYSTIEQTFSPIAMNEISMWIKKQLK